MLEFKYSSHLTNQNPKNLPLCKIDPENSFIGSGPDQQKKKEVDSPKPKNAATPTQTKISFRYQEVESQLSRNGAGQLHSFSSNIFFGQWL